MPKETTFHLSDWISCINTRPMFGLDHKSGVEIDELEPQISDIDPAFRHGAGGNHAYTNVQLSRYVAAIASRGNVFELKVYWIRSRILKVI